MLASKLNSWQYCIVCERWSISSHREWTLPLVCCPMPFNQQRMGATGESTMISQAGGSRRRRRIEDRFFCAPILLPSPLSAAHLYAEDRPTDCDRRSQGRAARFLDRITMSGIMIMVMLELGLGMSKRLFGRFRDLLPCFPPISVSAQVRETKSRNLETAFCTTLQNH